MDFELTILNWIQEYIRNDWLDSLMPVITALGNGGWFWIAGTLLLLIFPKTRKVGIIVALSLILEALCCNVLLKPLVSRTRPFDVNTNIQLLIAAPSDYSFPSGHTGISFAAAAALYFAGNRLWKPAGILAVLIAVSRLYLYVHYPTDVLAGALIGIVAGWAGNRLMSQAGDKR